MGAEYIKGKEFLLKSMDIKKILYVVVPCYNEEEVLPLTHERLSRVLSDLVADGMVSSASRILYVDDGSKDNTWNIISSLNKGGEYAIGIKLAHNAGHQKALWAGLTVAADYCDCAVSIDADLQDDPEAIKEMVKKHLAGDEIVLAVRSSRKEDSFFKRTTAQGYYKLLAASGVETVYNHADYRLLGKRALKALLDWKESNLYIRGIIPKLGFKTGIVNFSRHERAAGESKYSLRKMLSLALDGMTSFSTRLLSLDLIISALMFITFLVMIIVLGVNEELDIETAVLPCLFLCSSLIMLSRYIHGIYLGKTYMESKNRPKFVIEEYLLDEDK